MLSPRDPGLMALILRVRQDYDPASVEAELVSDLCCDAVEEQQAQDRRGLVEVIEDDLVDDSVVSFSAEALAGMLQQIRDEQIETRRLLQRLFDILGDR